MVEIVLVVEQPSVVVSMVVVEGLFEMVVRVGLATTEVGIVETMLVDNLVDIVEMFADIDMTMVAL